jgi:hypothetical protein
MYLYSLLQSTTSCEKRSKMGEPPSQEQYAARAALRGKMEKMQEELLKYKVNAVYRHQQT